MSYGIITPKFNSTEENAMMIIHNRMSNTTVRSVSDTLRDRQFHIVYDSRNIGKIYDTVKNSVYVCGSDIKFYVAGPAHTYYNTDSFTMYDRDIAIDRSIRYGLETAERPIRTFFSTRSRYIRIIDQVYFRTLISGYGITNCNLKFSYVSKIGVALPATIFGDTTGGYLDPYAMIFNVFDNKFQSVLNNNWVGETTLTRPFEMHDRQVYNNEAVFGSPAYIFDLSGL